MKYYYIKMQANLCYLFESEGLSDRPYQRCHYSTCSGSSKFLISTVQRVGRLEDVIVCCEHNYNPTHAQHGIYVAKAAREKKYQNSPHFSATIRAL